MAKKKTAEISTNVLAPFGFADGMDINEFLTAFGYYKKDKRTVEEFIKETFNL